MKGTSEYTFWRNREKAVRRLAGRSCPHGMAGAVYCATCLRGEVAAIEEEERTDARLESLEARLRRLETDGGPGRGNR